MEHHYSTQSPPLAVLFHQFCGPAWYFVAFCSKKESLGRILIITYGGCFPEKDRMSEGQHLGSNQMLLHSSVQWEESWRSQYCYTHSVQLFKKLYSPK